MVIKSYPFSKLPFSSLFTDYVNREKPITKFFAGHPFDVDSLKKKAQDFDFPGDRNKTADFLKSFNKSYDAERATFDNIERIRDEEALVVVTGQQMTLYGGPLYTVYKTLTTIAAAKRYEEIFNRPVIPVFWLADEDHDAEEISEIGIFSGDDLKNCRVEFENSEIRSSELSLSGVIDDFRECVNDTLFETDFSDHLWEILDSFYNDKHTVAHAFGKFLLTLFEKYGLVLAGSNNHFIKQHVTHVFSRSIDRQDEIHKTLQTTTDQLIEAGYHGQVHINPSNLFYINDENHRIKIQYTNKKWLDEESGKSWSSEELKDFAELMPERLSPNVFLRPIIQDHILPVISYVAGPGEVAYYAQMKDLYEIFDLKMPSILPRFSATIIESAIDRIYDKLPFKIEDYLQRIEDLESQFIEQSDKPDIEAIFGQWKQKVDELTRENKEVIGEIDPTLKNSAGKASATYFTELDKLKGKIYRSLKQQEKTQIDRISRIQSNLYPGGNLQEREVAFIYYLNKYGLNLLDQLLEEFQELNPDSHKLIYL